MWLNCDRVMAHIRRLECFLILTLVLLPCTVFAAANPIKSNVFNPTILAGPLVLCTGTGSPATTIGGVAVPAIPACSNLCDVVAQIAQVIYYAIAVVIWIITPILVAGGGIMIMLGGASPEMVGRGKKTITGAVWGVGIVLCAWLIVKTFISPVTGIGISGIGGFSSSSVGTSAAHACGL